MYHFAIIFHLATLIAAQSQEPKGNVSEYGLGNFSEYGLGNFSQYGLDLIVPWNGKAAISVDLGAHFEGKFYQGDRTNAAIHVMDTCTGAYLKRISGFAGCKDFNETSEACNEDKSGPNGNVIVPFRGHMWVGDGSGKLHIVDLYSYSILKTIDTEEKTRADKLAFDPKNRLVVATFPGATPPFLKFYAADTFEEISMMELPNATAGIGQPAWNKFDGLLYITVPKTEKEEQGEILVIDGETHEVVRTIKPDVCVSHGLTLGLRGQGYVGCSGEAIQDLGGRHSYIINTESGDKKFTIEGVSGIDQVNYDSRRKLFLVAASRNKPDPVLAIISAKDGKTLQTIKMTDKISRAVAVDRITGSFMIPTKEGFAIYRPEGSSCKSDGSKNTSTTDLLDGNTSTTDLLEENTSTTDLLKENTTAVMPVDEDTTSLKEDTETNPQDEKTSNTDTLEEETVTRDPSDESLPTTNSSLEEETVTRDPSDESLPTTNSSLEEETVTRDPSDESLPTTNSSLEEETVTRDPSDESLPATNSSLEEKTVTRDPSDESLSTTNSSKRKN